MQDASCAACHTPGGAAGSTSLVFVSGGGVVANYNVVRNYVQSGSGKGNLLLSKSIGLPTHGGGAPYVNSSSQPYQNLQALMPTLQGACPVGPTPTPTPTPSPTGFWTGVSFVDNATTLAKAAVMFASRNPTAAEYSEVAAGGNTALRSTIRSYMTGPAFDAFLDEAGDTVFLPQGVTTYQMGFGIDETDFPSLTAVLDGFRATNSTLRTRFVTSVQREGVELLKYIAKNDKPWTDMVAGNYTVMNGLLSGYFGASLDGAFVNPNDDKEWRKGTWKSERLGGVREHAGVLSTHAWLNRFPTTQTNRNRHRTLMLGRQFLGFDINSLAARPIDDGGTFLVPTLQNPNCTVCHDTMDPIAAGFQNWNERNRYLPYYQNGNTALPGLYRGNLYPKDANGNKYYQPGDNWFRDSKLPGYYGTPMPGGYTGNNTALQWLGGKVAADARFPLGAVHFWYQAVFGREPLKLPLDDTSAQYTGLLAAYNAQYQEFSEIAAAFATNRGHGAFNVKDLLVDLVMSKWFRAYAATSLTTARALELKDISSSNMLTPAHLQRKLKALLGTAGYAGFNDPYTGRGLMYGNFDGNLNTKRSKDYTILQTSTVDNLASVVSCPAAQTDFGKAAANRLLFPLVSLANTPATTAGQAAIVQNIRHLHKWLLKEDLPASDPEIARTYQLFVSVWNDRASAPPKSLTCAYTNTNDPNYTGRAWAAVIAYLVGDPKFLFE